MAKVYYNLLVAGKITFDQVPARYQDAVAKLLDEE